MSSEKQFAEELINFVEKSVSPFHAVMAIEEELKNSGYEELKQNEKWSLEKGKKYYLKKNSSAIFAFNICGKVEEGYKIVGGHTDSPCFRIKTNPEMVENGYVKFNTEVYGGPILNTWLDRPLSFAGRVSLRNSDVLNPQIRFVNIDRPIMIIPNLAIHMNRKVNEGVQLNKQKELLPIAGIIDSEFKKENFLIRLLAKELKVNEADILDFDLFTYEYEKGKVIGLNEEFISCAKLDDLEMVHAGLEAIVSAEGKSGINILVCFDNEEVGSGTKQGAGSKLLSSLLERIAIGLNATREEYMIGISNSFMISSDMAHAVHPNFPEKADPTNKPIINKGPVIKISASQSYTTDADSAAVYKMICEKAGVPYQVFFNRSDERGGSTIGPITTTHLDIRSVDIGNPMLAMHSVRELAGVADHTYVKKSFEQFFQL